MNIPKTFDGPIRESFTALVINLARREDRMRRISVGFPREGFNLKRVEAVDAQSPTFTRQSQFVTGPEEACWLSHQRAMRMQVEENLAFALVLEDDADLSNSNLDGHFLRRICDEMQAKGIHILQLGHLHNQYKWWYPGPFLENFKDLVACKLATFDLNRGRKVRIVKDSFRSGAHAYIVSLEAASEIISLNLPPVFSSDDFLGLLAKRTGSPFRVARVRKSLVNQWARSTLNVADLDSDIAPLMKVTK